MRLETWLGKDNQIGKDIWEGKYRFDGESFDEFLDRLSIGDLELRELLQTKKFLFAGRILANLNTGTKRGISNCTTAGYVEDTIEDIMQTVTNLAMSFKAEAGVGIMLSKIRPRGARIGDKVNNTVADGVLGFMKIFDAVSGNISRGGARRGALFMGLHCDHPDALDFINAKKDNTWDTGILLSTNISVLVTDEFMKNYTQSLEDRAKGMKNNGMYRHDFVVEDTGEVIEHWVDTHKIMDAIVNTPEKAFEPGIMFTDRFNEGHLFGEAYDSRTFGVNACTEFYGDKHTVCLLGSLGLGELVVDGGFDFKELKRVTDIAIRALDRVHDYGMGRNGLPEQNQRSKDFRGVGLGVMGLADAFIKMGITYGSQKSKVLSKSIAEVMMEQALLTSRELGFTRGQPEGILQLEKQFGDLVPKGLRNNSLLSIAPAGSISTMLGVSSGIEPVFRNRYTRTTQSVELDGGEKDYVVTHKAIEEYMAEHNLTEIPEHCVDSSDVHYLDKIELLASMQEHIDLSISNTTNLPKGTTVEEIKEAYIHSWKKGVKGLTVYVDSSIKGVLNEVEEEEPEVVATEPEGEPEGCGT